MAAVIQTDVSTSNDSQVDNTSNDKHADIKIVDMELQQDGKAALKDLLSKIKPSSFGQRRNYSRIDISAEKWLMAYDEASLAKLENPPSLADGICMELERVHSQALTTTLHSIPIIFLLLVVEPKTNLLLKVRKLFCLIAGLKVIFDHLELGGSKYMDMKNNVIKSERRLLNVLGFVVHVHHPHKLIYIYLHILGLLRKESDPNATKEQINRSKELLQKAWSYMNDGLRTDMFLRYTPETIACACIQLAAKTVEQPVILPKSPFPWFELFDASDRDIRLISQMLMCLYTRTKAPSLDFIHSQLEKHQKRLSDSDKAKELAEKAKAYADIQEAIKAVTSTKSTSNVQQTKKDDEKAVKAEAPRISKSITKHIGPPFNVMVDSTFLSYSIKNRLDMMKGFKDCLHDKVIPCIPECVVVELEKQSRFKSVLKIINDHRFQRLHCAHKKSIYTDECILHRITQ
uniref:Uncharacterized protein n=1 Tax=Meloidogyne javanica TaxID=6303 RepID=A0A915MBZ3_MELJA